MFIMRKRPKSLDATQSCSYEKGKSTTNLRKEWILEMNTDAIYNNVELNK